MMAFHVRKRYNTPKYESALSVKFSLSLNSSTFQGLIKKFKVFQQNLNLNPASSTSVLVCNKIMYSKYKGPNRILFIHLRKFQSDDVTKMILLTSYCRIFSIVWNNLSEKSSHTKKWLFSALKKAAEIQAFEVQISPF